MYVCYTCMPLSILLPIFHLAERNETWRLKYIRHGKTLYREPPYAMFYHSNDIFCIRRISESRYLFFPTFILAAFEYPDAPGCYQSFRATPSLNFNWRELYEY